MGDKPQAWLNNILRRYHLTSTVVMSLVLHLFAWGIVIWTGAFNPTIILAKKPEAKQQLRLDFIKPRPKAKKAKSEKHSLLPPEPPKPPKKKKLPNIFVQVDPSQASARKPDHTDKYSDKNSLAANTEPSDKPKPKIDGSQKNIPRTDNVPSAIKITLMPESSTLPIATKKALGRLYTKPTPPTRTPAKPLNSPNETENVSASELKTQIPVSEPRPKRSISKQNQTDPSRSSTKIIKKSGFRPVPDTIHEAAEYIASSPKLTRPLTLTEKTNPENPTKPKGLSPLERAKLRLVKAQTPKSQFLPGKAINQDGGAPRKGAPTFNVVLTGYGDYDNKLITAIYNSWVRKNHEARLHDPYRVVVEFVLLSSGRIEKMRVRRTNPILSQSIPEFICMRSIEEPAPFGRWDDKMKRALGNQRSCRITFSYNIRD